jgi:phosphoribosylaminoimidazolecarboxamide formyltransferase/IMP cyclohydrolase
MTNDRVEIRRALISVSDKSGLADLLKKLDPKRRGIELLSSGGTAKEVAKLGYDVVEVGSYTGYPESPGGYVKTLHPKIHGGMLLDPEQPPHLGYMHQQGIHPIDLVVVNLYPFAKTVADPTKTMEDARENEDIGGPAMIRSAAKGFRRVAILTDWTDIALLRELESAEPESGIGTDLTARTELMKKAWEHTAGYDAAISKYWREKPTGEIVAFYLGGAK